MEVANAFKERFGARIVQGYGLSESTGGASINMAGPEGSVGRALAGHELIIFREDGSRAEPGEVGEVAIKGRVVMKEYWKRPEATREVRRGDWLLTGDLGRMDEAGYLWVVDRKKDLVIRGGYNVYPREVEEVLYAHPAVREAAVIGVPDDRLGEEIAAVIAPQPGSHIDPVEMRAWLSEQLTAYKVPRIYHIVDELPKGATGKILKRALDTTVVVYEGARPRRVPGLGKGAGSLAAGDRTGSCQRLNLDSSSSKVFVCRTAWVGPYPAWSVTRLLAVDALSWAHARAAARNNTPNKPAITHLTNRCRLEDDTFVERERSTCALSISPASRVRRPSSSST
jgi:hypothetical protein